MLREAADQGHMEAQFYCGEMYDFGHGVAKDDRLALMYYKKAARQGHSPGQFNTGLCYRDGQGCEQSYERAAEYYEISFFEHKPGVTEYYENSFIRAQAGMVRSAGWLTQYRDHPKRKKENATRCCGYEQGESPIRACHFNLFATRWVWN